MDAAIPLVYIMTISTDPRLFVGTYHKYNSGNLGGGKWLTLTDYDNQADFLTACRELHNDETDPELMFPDYEGFPKALYSESDCSEVWEYIEFCQSSDLEQDVIDAGITLDIPLDKIEEAYYGQYDNAERFAEQLAEDIGAIKEECAWPYTCIDWEQAARELMQDFNEEDGYYFSNNY